MTILATGMEDHLEKEVQMDVHSNEDDYYEEIIKKLYRPVVKPTMAGAIQQELDFEVEPAPEPEPVEEEKEEPTMLDKWKQWLNNLIKDVAE